MNKVLLAIFALALYLDRIYLPDFFGEYRNYPACLILILIFALNARKQDFNWNLIAEYRNSISIRFLMLLVFIIGISGLFNAQEITENSAFGQYGWLRFVRQFLLLLISFFGMFWMRSYLSRIFRNGVELHRFIQRVFSVIIISLIPWLFMEYSAIHFDYSWPKEVMIVLDQFMQTGWHELKNIRPDGTYIDQRLIGITREPPSLAYLLSMALAILLPPAMFKKSGWFGVLIVLLAFFALVFTGSRTGWVNGIVLLLLGVSASLGYYVRISKSNLIPVFGALVFMLTLVVFNSEKMRTGLDFVNSFEQAGSNRTRFGSMAANWQTFREAPMLGKGLGQQAYYLLDHYPKWALHENSELQSFDDKKKGKIPGGFNLYLRWLAEAGALGLLAWLMLLLSLCRTIVKFMILAKRQENPNSFSTWLSLLLVVQVSAVNALQSDSFKYFEFWLVFAFVAHSQVSASLKEKKQAPHKVKVQGAFL